MRPSRAREVGARTAGQGDLDMVPMMNLFTVLVPVLLLAAVFARVSVLELSLPPKGSGEVGAERYEEKSPLNLLVVISDEGITVGGTGGFLPTLMKSDGTYKPEQLAALLDVVREEYPDEAAVTVASDSYIPYEDVLAVMDICRDRGFFEIALSGLHNVAVERSGEG